MPDTAVTWPNGLARVQRWERRTAWPLFAGSLVFFACFTMSWVDPHPEPRLRELGAATVVVLWVWFVADYFIRMYLARGHVRQFFATRGLDLLSIVLPAFRPFLILVTIWRMPVFAGANATRMRVRYGLITVLFAFIYVYVNSYFVWAVEKGAPGATIVNFEDAVWWGFVTISTVGYGDYAPVTLLGRVIAIGLMVGGVLVIGVTTATVLSYLTDRIRSIAIPDQDRAPAPAPAPAQAADVSVVSGEREPTG
ncbi:potassium channel family protein [Leucobacter sp. HY1908]